MAYTKESQALNNAPTINQLYYSAIIDSAKSKNFKKSEK